MTIYLKNIINYLSALIIFSDAYSASGIFAQFELRGSYFILPFVIILCIVVSKKIYLNKKFIIIFGLIILFSIYSIYVGKSTSVLVSKSVIGILLNSLTFYMVFRLNNGDVKKIFILYLNFAFYVGLIGLVQEINNIFKILPQFGETIPLAGTHLYRITSIFTEPAGFAETMIPAFFVSLASIINRTILINKWKSWIIISSFLLTFSTIGYFGIFISAILIIINYDKIKYLIIGAFLVPGFLLFAYLNINAIKLRVDGTYNVLTGSAKLIESNWSTFSLISNWKIGFISFIDSPIIGGGLGSHPVTYRKNIQKVLGKDYKKLQEGISIAPLNVEDAGSLFNRLLSETGLFGLFAFMLFLIKTHVLKRNDKSNYIWIINNGVMIFFLLKLLRGGHYFINGTFFFFWAYYFSKQQVELLKGGLLRSD